MAEAISTAESITLCGFKLSSTVAFGNSLPYFEDQIRNLANGVMKFSPDQLRKSLNNVVGLGLMKIKESADTFINDMLDSTFMNSVVSPNSGPHGNAIQLLTFFDTTSTILQPFLTQDIFQGIIKCFVDSIYVRILQLICRMPNINWTPAYITGLAQNVTFIGNMTTFASIPAARAHISGLIKMLNLLLSPQLAVISSDPQFMIKNKDIPYDAMISILSKYSADTNSNGIRFLLTWCRGTCKSSKWRRRPGMTYQKN